LASIGDMLRRSGSESSVLAGFLDGLLTYPTAGRPVVPATNPTPGDSMQELPGEQSGVQSQVGFATGGKVTQFEDSASRLLLQVAQRSRFALVESANSPVNPLPLQPGEEANASVQGTLPGGRVFVQLAGESLELRMTRPVQAGDILRLALVAQQPKLVFALLGQPSSLQPAMVSDAARWFSAMAANENGQSGMQQAVLERLQQVVSSLPPGSPALAAIMGEAAVYGAVPWMGSKSLKGAQPGGSLDNEVAKLLQALMSGNRMSLLEPELEQNKQLSFQPGQQLKGEVLQSLGGGRFMIQVAGQSMEVVLPKGIKAGDGLNLFFVGDDPPTMLLVKYGKAGNAQVSETGKWVSTLLGMQNQSAPVDAGLGILRTLMQNAPTDPAQLEQLLAKGLRESGLFYEAHLSRWFSGEFSLEDLMAEPQGKLSSYLNPALKGGRTAVQEQSVLPGNITHEQLESAIKSKAVTQAAYESGADARTLPIVKEQLATLQTGQMLFKGELFPGQPMEWRIEERENQKQQDSASESWESSLELVLPRLGNIKATVKLESGLVSVKVGTGTETTAAILSEGKGVLLEQLEAAGLRSGVIEVAHAP
jgi:hypothetical protein